MLSYGEGYRSRRRAPTAVEVTVHYYPLLRYARETKLRLPQARVASLDRIPDAAEACRREELFDSPNLDRRNAPGARRLGLPIPIRSPWPTPTAAVCWYWPEAIEHDPAGMRDAARR